jgi:hypothetical protein
VDDCPVAFLYEAVNTEGYRSTVVQPPRGIWGLIDGQTDMGARKA